MRAILRYLLGVLLGFVQLLYLAGGLVLGLAFLAVWVVIALALIGFVRMGLTALLH